MGQDKTTLGDRMKAYEYASSTHLMQGTPKIIRLDGKAFHTFLKNCQKPYDIKPMEAMIAGAIEVMKEIGGSARLAYIQSDECSIVLNDSISREFSPWFSNNIQKVVSVSSAIFTAAFNKKYNRADGKMGLFDARFFQVPHEEEMINNLIWRQSDATRNSVSQYARSFFSQKELTGMNISEMQDMMMTKGFNWNNADTWTKRGIVINRNFTGVGDQQWDVDMQCPIFKDGKDYLRKRYHPIPDATATPQNVHSAQG